MVIVAGNLIVAPEVRDDYLAGCAQVVRHARRAPGCLDFAIAADLLDPARINIFERWTSQHAVEAFRGSGPNADQADRVLTASVSEYGVTSERGLTWVRWQLWPTA